MQMTGITAAHHGMPARQMTAPTNTKAATAKHDEAQGAHSGHGAEAGGINQENLSALQTIVDNPGMIDQSSIDTQLASAGLAGAGSIVDLSA